MYCREYTRLEMYRNVIPDKIIKIRNDIYQLTTMLHTAGKYWDNVLYVYECVEANINPDVDISEVGEENGYLS